jgi:hypothetical protein
VCVCVALVIQHTICMYHIVICGLSGAKYFQHIFIKCVFWFSLQLLSETFPILKKILWDIMINVLGLHVQYLLCLSDFNQTSIFLTACQNAEIANFIKILQWELSCSMQTDSHDKALSHFSQFLNAPRKYFV